VTGQHEKRACDVTDRREWLVAIETPPGRFAVGVPKCSAFRLWWLDSGGPFLGGLFILALFEAKRSPHVSHTPFSFSLFSPFRSFLPTSDQHRTVCPPLALFDPSLFSLSPHSPLLPQLYRFHLLISTGTTPIILSGALFRTSLPFCRYMCMRTAYRTV
jgi:hypothetical protein